MKMIVEYIEHALTFERLAADEDNQELRTELESLALAYRKLVAERAAVRFTAA
jgi:hypothetical protein